jgi:hypothetical protein
MTGESEEKGFKVTDKRHFAKKETEEGDKKDEEVSLKGEQEEKKKKEETNEEEKKNEEQMLLPEINFFTFIFSLNSSALFHFGEIPDPITDKIEKNLPMAKQTIDIIGMLKEKTKGNLLKEEEALIDNILYDLRMRYVKETKRP